MSSTAGHALVSSAAPKKCFGERGPLVVDDMPLACKGGLERCLDVWMEVKALPNLAAPGATGPACFFHELAQSAQRQRPYK